MTDLKGDEGFAGRVMWTSAVVAAVFLVFLLQMSLAVSLGFGLGWATGFVGFLSWKVALDRLVAQGPEAAARQGKTWLLLIMALKLPIVGGILALAILVLEVDLLALAGGVAVVPSVVLLKLVGKACFGAARRPVGPRLV